jgi:hypothetical protein
MPLAAAPPLELPLPEPLALAPPLELEPLPELPEPEPLLALEPPEPVLPELEPPELEPAEVAGLDDGDLEPEAGGELPQPATTNATATSATPSQALPDLANVLLMVRGPPSVSVMPTASGFAAGDDEDAARCRLLPRRWAGRNTAPGRLSG